MSQTTAPGRGTTGISDSSSGAPEAETAVSYRNVGVAYERSGSPGSRLAALQDVSFDVMKGSFTSIIGPSGCGKTTLLRLCAGFQAPSSGSVLSNGQVVHGLNHRVGYVTQETNLYPWMTTQQNVEFALEVRGIAKKERHERSDLYLARMGLSEFVKNYPHQLSGGMQKRVCIAQTLIYEPEIVLMDEPFSGIDSQTRLSIESDLMKLWAELHLTILFVTHDLAEAISLSDNIVVLSNRPARLKDIYHVPVPRPRDVYEVQAEPSFGKAYGELWESYRRDDAAPHEGQVEG